MNYLPTITANLSEIAAELQPVFDSMKWIWSEFKFLIVAIILIAIVFGLISFVINLAIKFDQPSPNSATKTTQKVNRKTLNFNFNNGRKFVIKLESTLILSFVVDGVEQLGTRAMHLDSPTPGQFQITQINGDFKASLFATSTDGVNFYVFQCEMPTDTSATYTAA